MDVKNPTRRTMLTGSLGTAGLFGLSFAMADSAQAAQEMLPTVHGTDLVNDLDLVTTKEWHLARRACTAPTKLTVADIEAKGLTKWLDDQIDYTSIDDSVYESERAKIFPFYGMSGEDMAKKPWQWTETYAGYLPRATLHEQWRSKRQLRASSTNFFADLLSFSTDKVEKAGGCTAVNAIRDNALGKYKDMLKAMEYSFGMNAFLDNRGNTKAVPNQNLARELLELHTVGVGNYTQADVIDATTVLTGMDEVGGYVLGFNPDQHQNGAVKIGSWSNANSGGSRAACHATFDSLLDYLAHHPATAKRIATRMAIHYVSDTPPQSIIDKLAKVYLANDTAIGPMFKTLFTSDEFYASVGQKIRRPQIVAASALAAGQRSPRMDILAPYDVIRGNYFSEVTRMIDVAGHRAYSKTFPDGFPLESAPWITGTSLLSLINLEQLAFWRSAEVTVPDWMSVCNLTNQMRYRDSVPKAIQELTGFTVTNADVWRPISSAWQGNLAILPSIFKMGPPSRIQFVAASIFASPMFLVS